MRYYFDTEFIEKPCTIDLISIGIVAEDGREFYAISNEFDASKASPWVTENVIRRLSSPDYAATLERRTKKEIAQDILKFIGEDKPEFWAYYADYDWVVFCWLFGSMENLPDGYPMYCRDIKQWADQLGIDSLPKRDEGHHNAIADARWNRLAWESCNNKNHGR